MSRTASQCRINRSRRIASWAAKPWCRSSLFSPVSAFSRLPKRTIPTKAQSWDYDTVGNWDSVTTNSVTQTRGANRQNEITSVSGATTPTYDNNGNLTKDENDYRFVWDAWNREVKIKNSSNTVIATNAYDGLNHKVQVTTSAGLIDKIFGKNDWQVFEDKNGSNTLSRYVWSPAYVDGLVTRDRDTDANGTLDERLFALQDANWNVTGITNTSGTIHERYTETPYGVVTFRDGSGSTISVSTKGWDILHQGAKRDIIGDYDFRNRDYSPTLGRWLSNDPLGFNAGDVNTFRYVGNGPGNKVDPQGLMEPWELPIWKVPPRDPKYDGPGGNPFKLPESPFFPVQQPGQGGGIPDRMPQPPINPYPKESGWNWGFNFQWDIPGINGVGTNNPNQNQIYNPNEDLVPPAIRKAIDIVEKGPRIIVKGGSEGPPTMGIDPKQPSRPIEAEFHLANDTFDFTIKYNNNRYDGKIIANLPPVDNNITIYPWINGNMGNNGEKPGGGFGAIIQGNTPILPWMPMPMPWEIQLGGYYHDGNFETNLKTIIRY